LARDVFDLRTADIFNAATLGGAAALQRDDIGRLSAGAKAGLVMVDVTAPSMRPVRDPIQSLIYAAADSCGLSRYNRSYSLAFCPSKPLNATISDFVSTGFERNGASANSFGC
jgi:hypothetical protein